MATRFFQIESLAAPQQWAMVALPMPMAAADFTIRPMLAQGQRLRAVEVCDYDPNTCYEVVHFVAGKAIALTIPLTRLAAQAKATMLAREQTRPLFFRPAPALSVVTVTKPTLGSNGRILTPAGLPTPAGLAPLAPKPSTRASRILSIPPPPATPQHCNATRVA